MSPIEQRLSIDPLGYTDDHISHVAARFGYMDEPIVPPLLSMIRDAPTSRASATTRTSRISYPPSSFIEATAAT